MLCNDLLAVFAEKAAKYRINQGRQASASPLTELMQEFVGASIW